LRAVSQHREQADLLILMSASPDLYVPEIGARLGFAESICTGTQWHGARFDGALTTPNRQGPEKALCFAALQSRYPNMASVAYGNSAHDFEHMQLADEAWLVNPSTALLRAAESKHFHLANWR
jgi:phosphatidylglycerophosphatase C